MTDLTRDTKKQAHPMLGNIDLTSVIPLITFKDSSIMASKHKTNRAIPLKNKSKQFSVSIIAQLENFSSSKAVLPNNYPNFVTECNKKDKDSAALREKMRESKALSHTSSNDLRDKKCNRSHRMP